MKSFAIWIERTGLGGISTDNSRCPLEINFNYLTDCMEKGHHAPVLDFGIKYKHMEEMTNICLFVPFIIEKEEISDLGECLSQNKEILNSIFNENYTTHNVQSVSFCNVMEMGKTIFSVRTLDIEHDIELKEDYDGTIIKIQMKKPGEECAEKIYCLYNGVKTLAFRRIL